MMLSRGVAFACCNDTDPLVMRLYQQVGAEGRGKSVGVGYGQVWGECGVWNQA